MRKQYKEVLLRDFCEVDIPNKIKWINNPDNNSFLHYDIPLTYKKTLNWFRNKDDKKRVDCIIEYQGVPVGLIGLLALDFSNKKAEYYISMGDARYKHKGIATIATKLILEYAFDDLGLHKIYLNVDEQNEVACALYERTGFICEGLFEDDLVVNGKYINRKRYAIINR